MRKRKAVKRVHRDDKGAHAMNGEFTRLVVAPASDGEHQYHLIFESDTRRGKSTQVNSSAGIENAHNVYVACQSHPIPYPNTCNSSAKGESYERKTTRNDINSNIIIAISHAYASTLAAVSATSPAVSAASTASLLSSVAAPPATIFLTTSTVPSGLPASAASTFPLLSITKTPRVVPLGAFLRPIASMSVWLGSQRRGYGRFCLVLKVVFAFGESFERP
jgi:hypothetical protein